jgi:hypothetical protein
MTAVSGTFIRASVLGALALLIAGWTGAARAQEADAGTPLAAWPVASDGALDTVRGGFDVGNGLLASFGFQRLVYVNGSLTASTALSIPDIGHMTPDQASALAVLGTVNVIQNGSGSSFDPSVLVKAGGATVIQNNLDNQNLQSLTTIDAAVNGLDNFHSRNLQDSLQAGLIGSLGH